MGWKSTLFALLSVFILTSLNGQSCGENFFDSGGENAPYGNNESQMWAFCPDNEGDLVTINFTFVNIEGGFDFLSVFSGSDSEILLTSELIEPTSFTSFSDDGCLTLFFTSDGSVSPEGWEATITCEAAPACGTPAFLEALPSAIGGILGWLQPGTASLWDVEIGTTGFAPTGIPTTSGVGNPYTWEDGESGVNYDYYVRADCDDDGNSEWAGPFSFITTPECGDPFFDNGGPDDIYPLNENAIWLFCPDNEGDEVTLNFTFVDIGAFGSTLTIFNGVGQDGLILNPAVQMPSSYTSNTEDGCLTVTFISDGFSTGEGWEALVSCNPPPPCPNPSMLTASNETSTGADFSWLENGTATAWDIEIIEAGTTPTGTPTITGITANPFTWEDGNEGTVYNFYIRAQCGDGENSYWVGPLEFITLPGCGSQFFDTGGPNGDYQNNESLIWVFCPDDEGDIVSINFTFVDVEGCCDDLVVLSGANPGPGDILDGDLETPAIFVSNAEDGCITVTFDSDGSVINGGWEAEVACSDCVPIFAQDVFIEDINAFNAQIGWQTPIIDGNYLIEYDTTGFVFGEGNMASSQDTFVLITGLEENTTYDYYFTSFCPDGEVNSVLGPFTFTTLHNNDLGITGLVNPTGDCGLGLGEAISIQITNFGSAPQALFGINFSVNGEPANVGMPQDGFFTGIVSNDSTEVFEFDLHYNFDGTGDYEIQVWTELEGDSNMQNDTFTIIITNYASPFFEDFEIGVIPDYISTSTNDFVTDGHGNTSFVLAEQLFFEGDSLLAELPTIGPITDMDVLFFDFRYTDAFAGGPSLLLAEDSLMVLISEDCGENYEMAYLLTGNNIEPSTDFITVEVPLDGYEGSSIKIQILGLHSPAFIPYWLDIDNIGLPVCDDLALDIEITHTTTLETTDGALTVTPSGGVGPYDYLWEDGSSDPDRNDLMPGIYTVLLSDRFNCTLSTTVEVSAHTVGTETLPSLIKNLQLMPNPTSGETLLKASFAEALDTRVEIVNLLGQTVWKSDRTENTLNLDLRLDLSNLPSAMYLVRIHAGGQIATSKLLKTE